MLKKFGESIVSYLRFELSFDELMLIAIEDLRLFKRVLTCFEYPMEDTKGYYFFLNLRERLLCNDKKKPVSFGEALLGQSRYEGRWKLASIDAIPISQALHKPSELKIKYGTHPYICIIFERSYSRIRF